MSRPWYGSALPSFFSLAVCVLLLGAFACQPLGGENDESSEQDPGTTSDDLAGDKTSDSDNTLAVGDLTVLSLSELLKLQEDGAITMDELTAELTRRLKEDNDFIAATTGAPGPAGEEGPQGEAGIPITWLGSYFSDPAEPVLNHAYYNEVDGIAYVYDGSAWQVLAMDGEDGALGEKGDAGSQGILGDKGDPGLQGDPGPQGIQGPIGETGLQGSPGTGVVDRPVVISVPPSNIYYNSQFSYQIEVSGGQHPYLYDLSSGPETMTLDPVIGLLTWTPLFDDVGLHLISLSVVDSFGMDCWQWFELNTIIVEPEVPGNNSFIAIAGGTFQMGQTGIANEGRTNSSEPVHQVIVSDYQIQKYEVTAAEYRACVDAAVCEYNGGDTDTTTYNRAGYEDYPINYVNWSEAQRYCQWIGGDLPTEAQWEFAARGTAA